MHGSAGKIGLRAKDLKDHGIENDWKYPNAFDQEMYDQWKEKVMEIVRKNSTSLKKRNPRKSIKLLIKAKKNLKKEIKNSTIKRYDLISRIKRIDEQIKKERDTQFHYKVNKIVDKLKIKNGINGPNMWEVLKSVRKKRVNLQQLSKAKMG